MWIRRDNKTKCLECKGVGKVKDAVCHRCKGYGSITLGHIETERRKLNNGGK